MVLKKGKFGGVCIQQRCRVSWVCGTICQVYNRPGVHGIKLVIWDTVGLHGGVCCVTPTGLDEKGNVAHRWDCKHSMESQF